MNKSDKSTDKEFIYCQNCLAILATRNIDGFSYKPNKVNVLLQELTKDSTLHTFKCPVCDCFLQIKT